MKKFLSLLAAFLCCVSFSACSDDDDDSSATIFGKWFYSYVIEEDGHKSGIATTYEFTDEDYTADVAKMLGDEIVAGRTFYKGSELHQETGSNLDFENGYKNTDYFFYTYDGSTIEIFYSNSTYDYVSDNSDKLKVSLKGNILIVDDMYYSWEDEGFASYEELLDFAKKHGIVFPYPFVRL